MKSILSIVLLALCFKSNYAQYCYLQPIKYSTANRALGGLICNTDVNNDNNIDIIVQSGLVFSTFIGDGMGNLSTPITSTIASQNFNDFTINDFNNDGKIDIAYCDNSVYILAGDGAGNFTLQDSIVNGGRISIVSGDFNLDGKADIAAIEYPIGNRVTINLGQGNGTFAYSSSLSTPITPNHIQINDFNNDGKTDIVVKTSIDTKLFLSNGNGTFTQSATLSGGGNILSSGDYNGDNNKDLLSTNSSGALSIYSGNGTGGFAITNTISISSIYSTISADLNNDSKDEIIINNPLNHKAVNLLYLDNTSQVSKNLLAYTDLTGFGITNKYTTPADLNEDGLVDLITTIDADTNNVIVLLNSNQVSTLNLNKNDIKCFGQTNGWIKASATGTSTPFQYFWNNGSAVPIIGQYTDSISQLGTGDYELTLSTTTGCYIGSTFTINQPSPLYFYVGNTNNTCGVSTNFNLEAYPSGGMLPYQFSWNGATAQPSSTITNVSQGSYSVSVTDYNGCVNTINSSLVEPIQTNSNTFHLSGLKPSAINLVTGDFNNDGNLDFATASTFTTSQTKFAIGLGDGSGNVSSISTYSLNLSTNQLLANDFTNDSKMDLLTVSGSTVFVVTGNGTGTLTSTITSVFSFSNITSITDYDFNGDGFMDLAAAYQGNSVSILLGNGTGSFSLFVSYSTSGGRTFTINDFNNDGKIDLVFAEYNLADVLLGNGNGTFNINNNTSFSGNLSYPQCVASADFDQDGKIDIVVKDGNYFLSTLKGLGNGHFQTTGIKTHIANDFRSFYISDINADGKQDIIKPNGINTNVYLGDGTLQLSIPTIINTNSNNSTRAFGDFNNDNVLDIFTTNTDSNSVSVSLNCSVITHIPVVKKEEQHISIFPNPTIGNFEINTGTEKLISVEIYNTIGELIETTTRKNNIDISNKPKGMYLVHIHTNKGLNTQKLIVD